MVIPSPVPSAGGPDDPCWPRYCNAILRDARGRYLLEARSPGEAEAPGQLTCFGGGREPGESPEECIRRELTEELGFRTDLLELCVVLRHRRDGHPISWFFRGPAPEESAIRTEPGVRFVWCAWHELDRLPVGAWNRAALVAEREGRDWALAG